MKMPSGLGTGALIAAMVTSAACGGGSQPDPDAALSRMVARTWAAYSESIGYPAAGGAVLYVWTPSGAHFASTGMENASPGIHFRIASNTKTFTAAAIMLLQQRGLLLIDDVITANIPGTATPYVPDSPDFAIPHKGSITIRKLLSHTAGVYDVSNELMPVGSPCPYAGLYYPATLAASHQFTFDELVGVDAQCNASYWTPSEDRYHYSNTGYSLLGKIIERVSGLTYSEFITRNLIVPNGLTETSSPSLSTETTIPAPFAVGYTHQSGELTATVADNMSINVAEGNLISTPEQLARWNRALLSGTAGLDATTVASMKCTVPAGATGCYGLGIEQRPGLGYGHTGGHRGYASIMSYDPVHDVSVVLFFSLIDFDALDAQATVLLEITKQAREILGY
jgi:D-alanyl-D-alanine carboxypeptidase